MYSGITGYLLYACGAQKKMASTVPRMVCAYFVKVLISTSGLPCHSPSLCLFRKCYLASSELYVAILRFVIHAACVPSLLLPVFKVLSHMCQMSSEPHGAENTMTLYIH